MDEVITISEAAAIMGHADPTALYAAARTGLSWKAQADGVEVRVLSTACEPRPLGSAPA